MRKATGFLTTGPSSRVLATYPGGWRSHNPDHFIAQRIKARSTGSQRPEPLPLAQDGVALLAWLCAISAGILARQTMEFAEDKMRGVSTGHDLTS